MPVLLIREEPPVPVSPEPVPEMLEKDRLLRLGTRVVGLIAAVALCGTAWALLTRGNTEEGTPVPAPGAEAQGRYQFTEHHIQRTPHCEAHAYDDTKVFLSRHRCEEVVQQLLTTHTADGSRVVVAVSVVRMPTASDAEALKKLTDTDGTGNVNDLLREGRRVPSGPSSLIDAGYAAALDGRAVVIAEADFFDPERSDDTLLREIAVDALRAGHPYTS
ncbi:hypothetical protein GCM10012275_06870 [Longimycelium tulufanense]|uniref:Uncharacterized protein n=2 Tax=Longimycelium tulufanense TaxID=907463 RepID=A0A8J3FSQ8_9PSEU|nr:hypothetical protein GCM10012275_06870 [Longimycelium tulufanense]